MQPTFLSFGLLRGGGCGANSVSTIVLIHIRLLNFLIS